MEGRVPALTFPGTMTVIFAGTAAGLASGIIYVLVRRLVRGAVMRALIFLAVGELIAWRGVHGLLVRPQIMFMTLALIYLSTLLALAESGRATSEELRGYIGG